MKTYQEERAVKKHGLDKVMLAYFLNTLDGEGATVQSIQCGVHINSTSSMCEAGRRIWEGASLEEREELKAKFWRA